MNVPRRIGILAGGGTLPREIADSVAARGMPLHIVAIDSEANADFGPYPVTRVDWGQIGRMVAALRQNACTDLVIIGSVRRPDLGAIKPDFGFFRALATVARLVAAGGDDAVLRGVIRFFEGYGFRVVGPARLAPEIIIGEGPFGRTALTPADRADAQRGFEAVAALSTFDIGQAVVVTDGRVEAFEAAEGTDRMLARVAVQRRQSGQTQGGGRGVLVKRAKPTQDERIDLPAIGPATITGCVEAGFSGLALEAGRVLAAGRQEIMERAEACRFAIEGVVPETTAVVRRRRRRLPPSLRDCCGGPHSKRPCRHAA